MIKQNLLAVFAAFFLYTALSASLLTQEKIALYTIGNYQEILQAIETNPGDFNLHDIKGGFVLARICENAALTEQEQQHLVSLLLAKGANPNLKHLKTQKTALHIAASFNKCLIASKLLEAGASIDSKTSEGLTPLMFCACFEGNSDTITLLVNQGANINARTFPNSRLTSGGGLTALHLAAEVGFIDTMRTLIQNGANINLRTENGRSVKEVLESAFLFKRITHSTYVKASEALDAPTTDAIVAGLYNLKRDNILYEAIEARNLEQFAVITKQHTLSEPSLTLALQQAIESDFLEAIPLFSGMLNNESIITSIQYYIDKWTTILLNMKENLRKYNTFKATIFEDLQPELITVIKPANPATQELEDMKQRVQNMQSSISALQNILTSLSNFEPIALNLSKRGITDWEIAQSMREPRPISIRDLPSIIDKAITSLEKNKKNFRIISLILANNIITARGAAECISLILEKKELSNLESLDLSNNRIMEEEVLTEFEIKLIKLLQCKSFKSINLSSNYLGDSWLRAFLMKLQNMGSLELSQKLIF